MDNDAKSFDGSAVVVDVKKDKEEEEGGPNGFVDIGNGVGGGGLKLATDEAQAKLEQGSYSMRG